MLSVFFAKELYAVDEVMWLVARAKVIHWPISYVQYVGPTKFMPPLIHKSGQIQLLDDAVTM